MKLDELTLGEIKQLQCLLGDKRTVAANSIKLGETYFIRTITNYFTGKVASITEMDIVLENAAWIADTGRFNAALKNGEFDEVEPYPNPVIVMIGAIVDMTAIEKLPCNVK